MRQHTPTESFANKVILITGASLGVGLETARLFHAQGAQVVLTARRAGPLKEAAACMPGAHTIAFDACDVDASARALAEIKQRFGRLDGLVNNAGAHYRGAFAGRQTHEYATMVDVNLRAPVTLTHQALDMLRASGGFVVNVASLAGKVPLDGAAVYSATKFGLRALTYALAEELRPLGVRVSVVSPGPIDTGFIMDELETVEPVVFSQTMCSPQDVAQMIAACAKDGVIEREFPAAGAKLATLGYLIPSLRRRIKPLLERKGRRVKARLLRQKQARSRV